MNSHPRPMSDFPRHLRRAASTRDVSGLQQSRRIKGQLSRRKEGRCFQEVHFWIHSEVDPAAPCVRRVCKAIAALQRDEVCGQYDVHYHLWNSSGPVPDAPAFRVRMGEKCVGSTLSKYITELLNAAVRPAALRRRAFTRPGKQDLVVVFTPTNAQVAPDDLVTFIERAGTNRCLWILTKEELFVANRELILRGNQLKENDHMSKQPENKAVLHGYSERGVVNALFEDLVHANDVDLLRRVLKDMVPYDPKSALTVPDFDSFAVYVEPSLSDFGAPDVVVFLTKAADDVAVLFIEAKLCTFMQSVGKAPDYSNNSSSILHELFLKMQFWAHSQAPEELAGGVDVYDGVTSQRSFGKDSMVLDLAQRICGAGEAFFVALATDDIDTESRKPVDATTVLTEVGRMFVENKKAHPLDYHKYLFLMQWQRVYALAEQEPRLGKTERELQRNETKFSIVSPTEPTKAALSAHITAMKTAYDFSWSVRKGTGHTLNLGERALVTVKERGGFGRYYAELYLPKGRTAIEEGPFVPTRILVEVELSGHQPSLTENGKKLLTEITDNHIRQFAGKLRPATSKQGGA